METITPTPTHTEGDATDNATSNTTSTAEEALPPGTDQQPAQLKRLEEAMPPGLLEHPDSLEHPWFSMDTGNARPEALHRRMSELIATGMSQRKASALMAHECQGLFTADNIRKRHAYNVKVGKFTEEVGKTAAVEPLTLPLETHQTDLVLALATFFKARDISPDRIKRTFVRVIKAAFPVHCRDILDSAFVTFEELPEMIGRLAEHKSSEEIAEVLYDGLSKCNMVTTRHDIENIATRIAARAANFTLPTQRNDW